MKLSLVFLCLLLATLSLASIPLAEEEGSLSRKEHRKPSGKQANGGTPSATGKSSQAAKRIARNRKRALKRRQKKAGATKGLEKTSAGKKSSAVSDSGKSRQEGGVAQDGRSKLVPNFPKALVELIGEYLDSSYFVVFTRNWSAFYDWDSVAVDSERHYLIRMQSIQASSHGDDEPMSLGSSNLSNYEDFHSSHDGRSLFFTGKTKEQIARRVRSEKTAKWLVQETGTKSLKSVILEGGETSFAGDEFMLSANGKALVSMLYNMLSTWTTSVYQIIERGETASASKKADIKGQALAVSGNGNRILSQYEFEEQLEVHDISGDKSQIILEISYTEYVRTCALNNDGSKAAFTDDNRKLYIVDVGKEKDSISVDQLTPIDIPDSVMGSRLIYDAKDRLYAFKDGNLWLVDPSKGEFVSLVEAQVPYGYEIWSSAISPSIDYIALLFQSKNPSEKGEYQFQMFVKRKEDTKAMLMRLYKYES